MNTQSRSTLRHLGDIHREVGDLKEAEAFYTQALAVYEAERDPTPTLDLANALRGMALFKERTRQAAGARELWNKARDLYSLVRVEAGVTESSEHLALLAR